MKGERAHRQVSIKRTSAVLALCGITSVTVRAGGTDGPASIAFTHGHICQAAIAVNNGHSVKPVRVVSSNKNLVEVSYVRPTDGRVFRFWCLIEPSEVRWRDEYIGGWSRNLRIYYKLLNSKQTLEIRTVLVGEEQYPVIKTFTALDFK